MSICLTTEKKQIIFSHVNKLQRKSSCKIRNFAKLIGQLVAASPAVKYGWLHIKEFERAKYQALKLNNNDYNSRIIFPKSLYRDFSWWLTNIFQSEEKLSSKSFALEIFSDASTTGWGGFCKGRKACGFWNLNEKLYHINYLELLAAYYVLKSFTKDISNCEILLRIDNTTAISCINRMGSIKFKKLNDITNRIWQWCEGKNIGLFASYINSKCNVEADIESRNLSIGSEYELSNRFFQQIIEKFGLPEADLFATKLNKKCPYYLSWKPDPDSMATDAFTICWSNLFFYAFPPFSLISKALEKIIKDKATGIVVAPLWPSQPWYPLFMKLARDEVLHLGPNKNLLLSPFREVHPLHQNLILVAGKLSSWRL